MSQNYFLEQSQKQSLKQTQRLMMSPQMQQAISLLQMSIMELSSAIETELESNPLLEPLDYEQDEWESRIETSNAEQESPFENTDFEILKQLDEEYRDFYAERGLPVSRTMDDDKKRAYMENSIQAQPTLFETLMAQAKDTFDEEQERAIAEVLIGNFDGRGFLQSSANEIALLYNFGASQVQQVLEEIQTFDPPGVGAKDLRESLLLQLAFKGKKKSLAYRIIDQYFDDLIHNRIPSIQKNLNCSAQEIREEVEKVIGHLDFHPGQACVNQPVPFITPDAYIEWDDDQLVVRVNDDSLPTVTLNRNYLKMLEAGSLNEEAKEFIMQKIISAKWLIKNIYQRNQTLERILNSLIARQKKFFQDPTGKLEPLTMQTIAEELELHESTVARAVSNKYIYCPRGVIPLRKLFTNSYTTYQGTGISSKTVVEEILALIKGEDKRQPLSDEKISQVLRSKGIPCARRTVAKYRTTLKIGNTQQRKKF